MALYMYISTQYLQCFMHFLQLTNESIIKIQSFSMETFGYFKHVLTILVCSSSWSVACLQCPALDILALLVLSSHCIWAHSHCAPNPNQLSSWPRNQKLYLLAFPSLLLSPSGNLLTPVSVQSLTFQVQASPSLLTNPSGDPSLGKASSHCKELNWRHLPAYKLSHRS